MIQSSLQLNRFSIKMKFALLLILGLLFSIGLVSAVGTYPAVDPSMVLYYHFNNDSSVGESYNSTGSNIIYDYSGSQHNSSMYNVSYNLTGGILNDGALVFDGNSSYAYTVANNLFNNTNPITLSIWFNVFSNPSTVRYILGHAGTTGAGNRIYIKVMTDGELRLNIGASTDQTIKASGGYNRNQWYNLVVVRHSPTNISSVYWNGIFLQNYTAGSDYSQGTNMYMGAVAAANGLFNGSIDEFIVWNKSLTSNEILNNYNGYARVSINITTCQNLTGTFTDYYLMNDVYSNETCFYMVNAYHSSFYGNNHTIKFGNSSKSSVYGIFVDNTINTTVSNFTIISLNSTGNNKQNIRFKTSGVVSYNVLNTSGSDNAYGISITGNNVIIKDNYINTFGDDDANGIQSSLSSYLNIFNNTIFTNGRTAEAIYLQETNFSTLNQNYLYAHTGDGIRIRGNLIEAFNHTITTSNLVWDKPLNYTFNSNNQLFDNHDFTAYGQVYFAWGSNLTIINSRLNNTPLMVSHFSVFNFSANFINTTIGVNLYLDNVSNSVITNNIFITNRKYTSNMFVNEMYNALIKNNTFKSWQSDSHNIYFYISSNNTILQNSFFTFTNNSVGLVLTSSSNSNNISGNQILNLDTYSTCHGIYLDSISNNNFIFENSYNSTSPDGYFLKTKGASESNQLFYNTILTTNNLVNSSNSKFYYFESDLVFNITSNFTGVIYQDITDFKFVNGEINSVYINFTNLKATLIYYSNFTGYIHNGNFSETLALKNISYVLTNFNLTEGVSRQYSPIWFSSSSSTEKHIASNLTDTIYNVTTLFNVDTCDAGTIYYTPKDLGIRYKYQSYDCENKVVTLILPALAPSSESNVIEITYDQAQIDICTGFYNSGVSFGEMIVLIIIVSIAGIVIFFLFADDTSGIDLNSIAIIIIIAIAVFALGMKIVGSIGNGC